MNFTKYENYKDSGLDWLGEIPADWEVKRIKDIFRYFGSGSTPSSGNESYYEDGDINWLNTTDLNNGYVNDTKNKITKKALLETGLTIYPKNSLAIAMYGQGKTRGTVGLLNIETTSNQASCIMRKSFIAEEKYILWWFIHKYDDIRLINVGATQPNMNQDFVKFLFLQLPLKSEQTAIANFLDEKTSQIDKKIELLQAKKLKYQELRKTLINEAVTKGLDKNVELKDSGVEWIGKIPKHWEVKRVKDLFNLITDVAPNDNDYQLLSIFTSIGVKPREDMEQRGNKAVTTDGYWIVKKGDFIVNKLLAWMGAIALSDYDGVTSPAYDILRKKVALIQKYYEYLFRTEIAQAEFKRNSRGIMEVRLRLYFDKFGAISIPFPSCDEQQKIVNVLNEKTSKIDEIITTIDKNIAALNEFRKTLINDAVTGKFEVKSKK